jgi:two-component system, LytTR family, sensor kinase
MKLNEQSFVRRHALWIVPILIFGTAGILEAVHAFVGYSISGRPEFGYTLRGQPLSLFALLGRALPSWIALGIVAGIALRLSRSRPLFAADWKHSLAFHLPAALLFSTTFLLMAAAFRHFLFLGPETGISFATTILRYYTVYFNTHFLFYWGVVGVYSAFVYDRDLRERQLVAEKLQRGLTEARLHALKNQLQPHFLFNTLNAVSGLALSGDTPGTVRTLTLLGDLLRATLERREEVVSLADELELLDLYLKIQHVRFDDRLDVRLRIDEDVLDAEIPTFLLQPLVENAIRHGIADAAGGWIVIAARQCGASLRVNVSDSGGGVRTSGSGHGIGLNNCIARLEQLYGSAHLTIGNAAAGGASITLEWPLVWSGRGRRERVSASLPQLNTPPAPAPSAVDGGAQRNVLSASL